MASDEIRVVVQQPVNWPTLVIAFAALLGAIVSTITVVQQGRSTRRQLGIQNMWRLVERWDGQATKRAKAAEELLVSWPNRDELPDSVHDLLGTFELLAYLVVRSKTLPLEDAWINFSGPAIQWWHVCVPGVAKLRTTDQTIYEDYASLAEQLMELEAKRRNDSRENLRPSDADLRVFLEGERRKS